MAFTVKMFVACPAWAPPGRAVGVHVCAKKRGKRAKKPEKRVAETAVKERGLPSEPTLASDETASSNTSAVPVPQTLATVISGEEERSSGVAGERREQTAGKGSAAGDTRSGNEESGLGISEGEGLSSQATHPAGQSVHGVRSKPVQNVAEAQAQSSSYAEAEQRRGIDEQTVAGLSTQRKQNAQPADGKAPGILGRVNQEIGTIEWPKPQQAVIETIVVMAIVIGSSAFLFGLNSLLTEIAKQLY